MNYFSSKIKQINVLLFQIKHLKAAAALLQTYQSSRLNSSRFSGFGADRGRALIEYIHRGNFNASGPVPASTLVQFIFLLQYDLFEVEPSWVLFLHDCFEDVVDLENLFTVDSLRSKVS